jgi:ABC-type glycerol-3-phosphate transport system substrate-binding protein
MKRVRQSNNLLSYSLARFILITLLLLITAGCGGGGSSNDGGSSSNSATLTWDAPTTNVDGTPLTDLAGYKVYYGTALGNYKVVIGMT